MIPFFAQRATILGLLHVKIKVKVKIKVNLEEAQRWQPAEKTELKIRRINHSQKEKAFRAFCLESRRSTEGAFDKPE